MNDDDFLSSFFCLVMFGEISCVAAMDVWILL